MSTPVSLDMLLEHFQDNTFRLGDVVVMATTASGTVYGLVLKPGAARTHQRGIEYAVRPAFVCKLIKGAWEVQSGLHFAGFSIKAQKFVLLDSLASDEVEIDKTTTGGPTSRIVEPVMMAMI